MSVKVTERERRVAKEVVLISIGRWQAGHERMQIEDAVAQIIATEVSEPYRELLREMMEVITSWPCAAPGFTEHPVVARAKALLEEQ